MGKSRITPEQRALRTKLGEMMAGTQAGLLFVEIVSIIYLIAALFHLAGVDTNG